MGIREIVSDEQLGIRSCEWINLRLLKARSTSASETSIEFKVFGKTLCAGSSSNLKALPP